MPESQDICSVCGKSNSQLLMLNCPHDPCVQCATRAFAKQVYTDGLQNENYNCEVCSQKTELDYETIKELNSMAAKYLKAPVKDIGAPKPVSKERRVMPKEKKITFYCKQHNEQQITYYCFACEASICPECAIHGAHFGHEVILIKKAVARVEKQYLAMLEVLDQMQKESQNQKQGYAEAVEEVKRMNTEDKEAVTEQFDKLRAALAERQKQLHANVDKISQANLKIIEAAGGATSTHHQQAEDFKKTIESTLKKEDVLILDESKRIDVLKDQVLALREQVVAMDGQSGRASLEVLREKCKKASEKIGKLSFQVSKSTLRDSSLGKSSIRDSSIG